jgi:hypothetical protein
VTDTLRDQIHAILDGGISCGACGTPDWYTGQIMAVVEQQAADDLALWRSAAYQHARERDQARETLAKVREYLETSDDDGVRTRQHILGMLDRAGVPSGFRWHVLSQCPDEQACTIHGRNDEPAACPPACAEAHTYDGDCQQSPYLDGVIGSGWDNGRESWVWRCEDAPGCDGLLSLGHGSAAEARRSYDRHCNREHGPAVSATS